MGFHVGKLFPPDTKSKMLGAGIAVLADGFIDPIANQLGRSIPVIGPMGFADDLVKLIAVNALIKHNTGPLGAFKQVYSILAIYNITRSLIGGGFKLLTPSAAPAATGGSVARF